MSLKLRDKDVSIIIPVILFIIGMFVLAILTTPSKADYLKQAPPVVTDPNAYREITTENGVITSQIEIYDDNGTITYRIYDGSTTTSRPATAAEIAIYNENVQQSNRLQWLSDFVDELNLCGDEMEVAEGAWSGWGVNARDQATIEQFRCEKYVYRRSAKAWNALVQVLLDNGVDITP